MNPEQLDAIKSTCSWLRQNYPLLDTSIAEKATELTPELVLWLKEMRYNIAFALDPKGVSLVPNRISGAFGSELAEPLPNNDFPCVSIKPPWPYIILKCGSKVINSPNPTDYRGTILVHTNRKVDPNAPSNDSVANHVYKGLKGFIVGQVDIIDCVKGHDSLLSRANMFQWVVTNPKMYYSPIEYKFRPAGMYMPLIDIDEGKLS